MIDVTIVGAAGRMGKANTEVFFNDPEVKIVGAVESPSSKYLGQDAGAVAGIGEIGVKITDSIEECAKNSSVIVDFTNVESTLKNIEVASRYNTGAVIGTTGFNEDQKSVIADYSKNIPIVFSPNMSVGVNLLFYLVRKAAGILGDGYETEIVEIHHNQKKDAPSGTALAFGRIIAEEKGLNFDEAAVYGRNGNIGARNKNEIGILAVRIADVVGEHTIIFGGPGERIEFIHKSNSRKTFASGALRAAKFVATKKSGLYSMEDVLGIKKN